MAGMWSELPLKILSSIGKRLECRADFFRFRSVCKNWRSSLNPNPNPNPNSILSPILPRLISNPSLPFSNHRHDPLLLVARAIFVVESLEPSDDSHCWILTVEETKQGKLRILYPLSTDPVENFPSNFPKFLDLSKFSVSQIDKSYGLKFASDGKDVCTVHKVVLCSDSTIMVLYGEGTLVGVRFENGDWGYVRHSLVRSFSDVISFKGMVCAVDYQGDVSFIDYETMKVVKTVEVQSIGIPQAHRKLLVETKSTAELWLVVWYCKSGCYSTDRVQLAVYKLNEKKREWVCLESPYHWVPFVSVNSCFLVNSSAHLDSYVVYSERCFDSLADGIYYENQLFEGASVNLHINLFHCKGENKSYHTSKQFCRSIAEMLWPPPTWFWPDTFSSSSQGQAMQTLCSGPVVEAADEEQTVEAKTTEVNAHALSTIQNMNLGASVVIFEGLEIKSNLALTLQEIWAKHGNIMEGSKMRNGEIVARALESLATAVLILQRNSGKSLDEIQAEYLSSTLSDLQYLHFKVDWLVPVVEKALAVQKSKPLLISLKEFYKAKARAGELKSKVLDELANLVQVEGDLAFVFDQIPVLESVVDQFLGDGLC